LFVNIYAPKKVQDQCQFLGNLNKKIEDFVDNKEHKITLGGDFNVIIGSDLDCSGWKPFKIGSVKQIQDLCLDFDLVDICEYEIRSLNVLRGGKNILSFREDMTTG